MENEVSSGAAGTLTKLSVGRAVGVTGEDNYGRLISGFERSGRIATEHTHACLANPNPNASADDVLAFLQKMFQAVVNLTAASVEQQEAEPEYPWHA